MTMDAHLKIVRKTGSSKNKKQHPIQCEYIHVKVNDGQLMVYYTASIHRELRNQFVSARNGNLQWLTKAFVRSVTKIELHDVVSSRIFLDKFWGNCQWEQTKQAVITLEETTEEYMVEVIAESHY
jgi:hypothetical protein